MTKVFKRWPDGLKSGPKHWTICAAKGLRANAGI